MEHTRRARERLGPDRLLAPELGVLLDGDRSLARARARERLAHCLRLPDYVANLERMDYCEEDFRDGGSDRLLAAVVAWGDEDAIRARVATSRLVRITSACRCSRTSRCHARHGAGWPRPCIEANI